ncbi:hypothetical protein [Actinotalea sp.]|uniref:hypothetical protein n=1 Tax=Actinotalea sp. TaxID=1872145 RepID=UPI00356745B7
MSELTPYEAHTDVARTDPTGGRLIAWASAATAAHSLAKSLAATTFVPKHFQGKPGDATAAIILGDELGLSPLSALRSIHVISGTPGLYARTMVALVLSHGHEIWTEDETERKVTVAGRRRGSEHVEKVTWTIDRATKAGYTSNAKYRTDPIAMLYARASGDVARRIAPDVLAGVPYSIEEIELAETPTVTVARGTGETRKVSRAARPEPVEPDLPEPEVPSEPVDVTDAEILPDEPDPITPAQSKAMHAALGHAGLSDRDLGLRYISDVIGRTVETSKDLSKEEASRIIDALVSEGNEADAAAIAARDAEQAS